MDDEDRALLAQFIDRRNERAFAELVRRHMDLVYAAARRQSTDADTAQDVTQMVFIMLAEKAQTIRRHEAIAGWLLATTRCIALNEGRARARRLRRERENALMRKEQTGGGGGDPGQWDQIAGVVDDAVARLRPGDRDALILRYFQNRSFEQIGVTTGVSADAARKRVSRAMAQLRDWFARRGIRTSGQALGSMLLAHALAPAPAGISAAQIAQAALGGAEIGAAGAKGAVILMTTTTAKIAAAAVIAVLGIGVPVVYLHVRTTRAAAPQASTARGGDWQSEFRRVYALVPGQMLKRIGAPYIPARRDFARQQWKADSNSSAAAMFIVFDGQDFRSTSAYYGSIDVGETLKMVADIWPQETDLNRVVIGRKIVGDWVVREGATAAQKVDGLMTSIPEVLGPGRTLVSRMVLRDAIVARGTFAAATVRQSDRGGRYGHVVFAVDEGDKALIHQIAQTPAEMLKILGEITGRPVVVDDVPGLDQKLPIECEIRRSANLSRTRVLPGDDVVDKILARVAQQTALEFHREKRPLPTWCLTAATR